MNLIALYGRQQNWEKAESHYRALELIGRVPAEGHYNFGICLAAQRKSSDAADEFRKALAVNPSHTGALSSLGQLAELEGRVDEAEASYRGAAAVEPNDPQLRFNIGRMLIARGRFTEAIAELEPLKSLEHPDRARFLFGLLPHSSWRVGSTKGSGMRSKRGTWPASEGSVNWPTRLIGN